MRFQILIVSVSLGVPAAVYAQCNRVVLQEAVDRYLSSQTSGKSNLPLASNDVAYTQNFRNANIQTGILSKPITIAHNRSLLDTTQCATFTEIIAHTNDPPYVIGTQMRFDSTGKKLTKMESLVTTKETGSSMRNRLSAMLPKRPAPSSPKANETLARRSRLRQMLIWISSMTRALLFHGESLASVWKEACTWRRNAVSECQMASGW
jgi:hypothetical protein